MDETEREELKEAYRREKDPRAAARMLAVRMVYVRKAGIGETAAQLKGLPHGTVPGQVTVDPRISHG